MVRIDGVIDGDGVSDGMANAVMEMASQMALLMANAAMEMASSMEMALLMAIVVMSGF